MFGLEIYLGLSLLVMSIILLLVKVSWWNLDLGFLDLENFGWGEFWKFWRCGVEVETWMRMRSIDRSDPGPRSRTRSTFRKFCSDPHTDPGKPYPQPYPGSNLNSQSYTGTVGTRPPPLTVPPLVPTPTATLTKNSTGPSHGPSRTPNQLDRWDPPDKYERYYRTYIIRYVYILL